MRAWRRSRCYGQRTAIVVVLRDLARRVLQPQSWKRLVIARRNHVFSFTAGIALPAQPDIRVENAVAVYPSGPEVLGHGVDWLGDEWWGSFSKRLEGAEQLAVVSVAGTVVHVSLVRTAGFGAVEGAPRAIVLGPGRTYIHHCETSPAFRGKGLYPFALHTILARAVEQGDFQEVLIVCRDSNEASIRGILKAGFGYRCSYYAVGLLGERLSFPCRYIDQRMARSATGPGRA